MVCRSTMSVLLWALRWYRRRHGPGKSLSQNGDSMGRFLSRKQLSSQLLIFEVVEPSSNFPGLNKVAWNTQKHSHWWSPRGNLTHPDTWKCLGSSPEACPAQEHGHPQLDQHLCSGAAIQSPRGSEGATYPREWCQFEGGNFHVALKMGLAPFKIAIFADIPFQRHSHLG